MAINLLLSFDVWVFDSQTPDVEVIAHRDNNGVLEISQQRPSDV